jgi:lactate dehydrogenase-like 2-hydroxyacid dehydrogenase
MPTGTHDVRAHVLQIAAVYDKEFLNQVEAEYGLIRSQPKDPLGSVTASARQHIQVLLTNGSIDGTTELMCALPNLGLICCLGSGYEKIDIGVARERGIQVTHSPGANASSVADMAVTMLLASVRQLRALHAFVAEGRWQGYAGRPAAVRGMTGLKVGIVGLGDIGLRIARRIEAFETEVAYHNRRPRSDVSYRYEPTLLGLANWADALFIAARADATNRKMIDAEVLAALGREGHIVNISRGSIIDEPALIAALQTGGIAGAGLDVFAEEPQVPEVLRKLPNVVLSPHRAPGTVQAVVAMHRMVWANLDAFFRSGSVINPVPELAAR